MDEQDQAQGQTQEQASADTSGQPQDQAEVGASAQVPAQVVSGGNVQVPGHGQFTSGGSVVETRFEQAEQAAERLMTVITQQVEQVLERLREEAVTLSPAKWSQAMDAFAAWCLSVEARLAALEGKKSQDQDQAQG